MIEGIRSLQADLGVEVNGSMRPGGPEEAALTAASEGGSASGGGTVHVHSYSQERNGHDVRVAEHTRSAPGRKSPRSEGKTKDGGAMGDFLRNYKDMRDANYIGGDKYFHCKANCEATKRGPLGEATAEVISDARELIDHYIKNDSAESCEEDQKAKAASGLVPIREKTAGVCVNRIVPKGCLRGTRNELASHYSGCCDRRGRWVLARAVLAAGLVSRRRGCLALAGWLRRSSGSGGTRRGRRAVMKPLHAVYTQAEVASVAVIVRRLEG